VYILKTRTEQKGFFINAFNAPWNADKRQAIARAERL
jgi:hypothetical protein